MGVYQTTNQTMRAIKFRAWDGKQMTRAFALDERGKPFQFLMSIPEKTEDRDWPVMQFTGLTDKNGRDIYEGDVVRGVYEGWGIVKGQVVWVDCSFEVSMLEPKDEKFWDLEDNEGWEVIGNVFENQELLETA
jgi:uncharacterized phage protein (TIGR01671 family)